LNASSNIIRVIKPRIMRWAGHVTRMEMSNACKRLVGKPQGKRLLRRPKRRWEDNIRMNLKEIGWKFVYRIHLAQDRSQ
jgi:hypothetical protein